jgi:predicted DNA-binding transcriptional regulator AlpA
MSERLLSWKHVSERLDLSESGAWRLRRRDARFPVPVRAPGCNPRWLESELDHYCELLALDRDAAKGAA